METLTAPPPVAPPPVVPLHAAAPPVAAPQVAVPAEAPKTRGLRALAEKLASRGVTPNAMRIASAATAVLGALLLPLGTLVQSGVGTTALLLAAVCIQLRFVCAELRVLIGRGDAEKRPLGFDTVQSLLADAVTLAALGYAASATVAGPVLGWTGALLGLLLAHILVVDGAKGPTQDLTDLASPKRRMAVVTGASLVAALLPYGWRQPVALLALAVIAAGCGIAIWFRMVRLAERPDGG